MTETNQSHIFSAPKFGETYTYLNKERGKRGWNEKIFEGKGEGILRQQRIQVELKWRGYHTGTEKSMWKLL